jgi:hypothetical protein
MAGKVVIGNSGKRVITTSGKVAVYDPTANPCCDCGPHTICTHCHDLTLPDQFLVSYNIVPCDCKGEIKWNQGTQTFYTEYHYLKTAGASTLSGNVIVTRIPQQPCHWRYDGPADSRSEGVSYPNTCAGETNWVYDTVSVSVVIARSTYPDDTPYLSMYGEAAWGGAGAVHGNLVLAEGASADDPINCRRDFDLGTQEEYWYWLGTHFPTRILYQSCIMPWAFDMPPEPQPYPTQQAIGSMHVYRID